MKSDINNDLLILNVFYFSITKMEKKKNLRLHSQ